MLWSIAAGPLVNVALLPVLTLLWLVSRSWGWEETMPNTAAYLWHLNIINGILLGFNLLPVYPLDGGQMLRSLLWFALGRTRSLMVTSVLGMVGVVLLFLINPLAIDLVGLVFGQFRRALGRQVHHLARPGPGLRIDLNEQVTFLLCFSVQHAFVGDAELAALGRNPTDWYRQHSLIEGFYVEGCA